MGGFGSGRPSGRGKSVAEAHWSLDVNQLRRVGVLSAGWFGGWEWKRNGERVSSLSICGGEDRIVLSYRSRIGNADWQDVEEPIPIRWLPCRYSGRRPYFACPGVVNGVPCHRRVVKLYCAGRYYLCRHCYRLTYASCNEDRFDRALRRASKTRLRLGGEPGNQAIIPQRPKGMWRKTYDRLFEAILHDQFRAEERLELMATRLLDRNRRCTTRTKSRKPKGRYW